MARMTRIVARWLADLADPEMFGILRAKARSFCYCEVIVV